jgi:hypothetical protein
VAGVLWRIVVRGSTIQADTGDAAHSSTEDVAGSLLREP